MDALLVSLHDTPTHPSSALQPGCLFPFAIQFVRFYWFIISAKWFSINRRGEGGGWQRDGLLSLQTILRTSSSIISSTFLSRSVETSEQLWPEILSPVRKHNTWAAHPSAGTPIRANQRTDRRQRRRNQGKGSVYLHSLRCWCSCFLLLLFIYYHPPAHSVQQCISTDRRTDRQRQLSGMHIAPHRIHLSNNSVRLFK